MPLLNTKLELNPMSPGAERSVIATDAAYARDIPALLQLYRIATLTSS